MRTQIKRNERVSNPCREDEKTRRGREREGNLIMKETNTYADLHHPVHIYTNEKR